MKKVFIVYIIFICPLFSNDWQFLGLKSESISAISVDWSNPDIIYAGSSSGYSSGRIGGIFKSINGGVVWDTLLRGVTIRDLDIHPYNPNIIYATLGLNVLTTPGIIKSEDGGSSWFWADSGIIKSWEEGPSELIIDPKHPDTLYTGTAGFFGGRFYKSIDGGEYWFSLGDTTRLRNGVTAIEIDPENSDIIYAGTAFSGNLLKSKDGGNNWQLTNLPEVGIVNDIKIDPVELNRIFCGAHHTGIYISPDSGISWDNPNYGLPHDTVFSVGLINICANNSREVYVGVIAWENEDGGIYKSIDCGKHWIKIESPFNNNISYILINNECQYIYACGMGIYKKNIYTTIHEKNIDMNSILKLYNYPNPFNNETIINYQITLKSYIELEIFDVLGRKQKTLLKEFKNPGNYKFKFISKDLASGIYIVQLKTEKEIIRKKIINLR